MRRFHVRVAGFLNLKFFSLEIKWPILTRKRCIFVVIVNEPLKTFLLDLLTHPRQRDPTCSPMFQNIAQKGATTVLN